MIVVPHMPSYNEGGLCQLNGMLLTMFFTDDKPVAAIDGRHFQWNLSNSEADALAGDYGARSGFWHPGHTLREGEFGIDGRDFVRGVNPMGEEVEWPF